MSGDKSREYRDQMNFDNAVCLPAINDVRKGLASGRVPDTELYSLLGVIPEPVREDVMGDWDEFEYHNDVEYQKLIRKNNELVKKIEDAPSYRRKRYRPTLGKVKSKLNRIRWESCRQRLLLIIDSLDRHGLLRKAKVVEMGEA